MPTMPRESATGSCRTSGNALVNGARRCRVTNLSFRATRKLTPSENVDNAAPNARSGPLPTRGAVRSYVAAELSAVRLTRRMNGREAHTTHEVDEAIHMKSQAEAAC